jgi:hypothetical protein
MVMVSATSSECIYYLIKLALLNTRNFLGHRYKFTNGTATNGTAGNASTGNGTVSKIVTTAPFTISSCDQVIQIETQKLTDLDDFTKKSPAFYTISAFMMNLFEKKDTATLLQSTTLDRMVEMPTIIQGSVSCLEFKENTGKSLYMCLPNKDNANQMIKAFGQLMKCRMGDNLKDAPASTIKNVLKASCLGLDVNYDIKKFGGDINAAKASLQAAMAKAFKNAAKNLKGFMLPPKPVDTLAKLDGKAK